MTTLLLEKGGNLHRLGSRYAWTAPAVAALLYPLALAGVFRSARLVHETSAVGAGVMAFITSLMLSLAVPALALSVVYVLGQREAPSPAATRARRLAHLAFASPPLFTLIGVALYLLHAPWVADYVFWALLWLAIAIAVSRPAGAAIPATRPTVAPWLTGVHGLTALALLAFLLPHVANHVTGIWSPGAHVHVMKALRTFYRNPAIEPVLVLVVLFQIGSGLVLFWRRSAQKSDLFGALQTCAAVYLAVFLSSHLTAVFVLARAVMRVDSDFFFAAGAPAGLLLDYWNVRLIPHYFLAVWCLFIHLGCGSRAVMLSRYRVAVANGTAWWVIGVGGLLATVIITGLAGLHLGPNAGR